MIDQIFRTQQHGSFKTCLAIQVYRTCASRLVKAAKLTSPLGTKANAIVLLGLKRLRLDPESLDP
jgi:hypothetical protein